MFYQAETINVRKNVQKLYEFLSYRYSRRTYQDIFHVIGYQDIRYFFLIWLHFLKICEIISNTVWKVSVTEVFLVRISRIRIEFRKIIRICPYSIWMREIKDQKNSEYGHFSHSVIQTKRLINTS